MINNLFDFLNFCCFVFVIVGLVCFLGGEGCVCVHGWVEGQINQKQNEQESSSQGFRFSSPLLILSRI